MCPPSGTHRKFFSATHAWYCATYRFYPARSTIFAALICAFRLCITHTSLRLFTHALTCAFHEMRKFSTTQKIFFANAHLTWNVDTNWQIELAEICKKWQIEMGKINKNWQIGLAAECTRNYTTLTSILNPSPSSSPLPSNSGSKYMAYSGKYSTLPSRSTLPRESTMPRLASYPAFSKTLSSAV